MGSRAQAAGPDAPSSRPVDAPEGEAKSTPPSRKKRRRTSRPKRPLSPGAQLRANARKAHGDCRRLQARLDKATDAKRRDVLREELKRARKRLRKAESKLEALDKKDSNVIVGGPMGLRTSGVGIIRPGSR